MNRTSNLILRGLLLATSCLAGTDALAHGALPTGGNVVAGKARITQPSSTRTVVRQSTNKALIDWDTFSIGKGSSVVFRQPNQGSITVNRVIGPDSSQIFGNLTANGQIWLINGNGILFGKGSQINVEGLIATTSDMTDQDFKKGHYSFSTPSANPDAAVVNAGVIRAGKDGSVVLSASQVANKGLIQARLGTVVMGGASAFTVDMDGDNLIRYQISKPVREQNSSGNALVSNSGTIKADGGRVLMTARAAQNVQDSVINNTGIVEATSVHAQNGTIILDGGSNGTVDAGGTLDASGDGAGQTGGTIRVTGQNVNVERGALLDASGRHGGGRVLVGGNFHGKGAMRQAENTVVARGATIRADATGNGDGGRVAVWSTGQTVVSGRISAHGGALSGNGGFVETSGHYLAMAPSAHVNLASRHGASGNWLLDPQEIDIQICQGDCISQLPDGNGQDFNLGTESGNTDIIDPTVIEDALVNGNVRLEASQVIKVLDDLTYGSSHTLSLLSEGDIYVAANIQNSGDGDINLVAGWDGTTRNPANFGHAGVYGNNDNDDEGSVYITSDYDFDPGESGERSDTDEVHDVAVGSKGGTTSVYGNNIELYGYFANAQIGYAGAGTGDIVVDAVGNVDLIGGTSAGESTGVAMIGNGQANSQFDPSGNITVNAGGNITLDAEWRDSSAQIGNGGETSDADASGNITVTTDGSLLLEASGLTSNAQIGNGGLSSAGSATGNITVSVANDLTFDASGDGASAQIGNGGAYQNSSAQNAPGFTDRGDIVVTAGGEIAMNGSGSSSNASIGNGGSWVGSQQCDCTDSFTGPILFGGNVSVTAGTKLDMEGTGEESAVWIGNGGPVTLTNADVTGDVTDTGNITVKVGSASTAGQLLMNAEADGGSANVEIGNGGHFRANDANVSGTISDSGTIDIKVLGGSSHGGDLSLISDDSADFVQIGNGSVDQAGGAASGDIKIKVDGALEIDEVAGSISEIGNTLDSGALSGDVSVTAQDVSGLTPSMLADLPFGNFSLTLTGDDVFSFDSSISYNSPFTLSISSAGGIELVHSLKNTGTGDIDLSSDGNIVIGGADASGNVSVGSRRGNTNISGNDITVEADNGSAQIGFDGNGTGDISVDATGNITVQSNGSDLLALVGNGGWNATQDVSGNIQLATSGGAITVNAAGSGSQAAIGNLGNSSTGSQSGDIMIDTNGGALDVLAGGEANDSLAADAFIGNGSLTGTSGGATGDILIDAGAVLVHASGDFAQAFVGNGLRFTSSGKTGGDITIDAQSLTEQADTGSNNQARIANRSNGKVVGTISISTTGDIAMSSADGDLAAIGNGAGGSNVTTGDIVIASGGSFTMTATGSGETRVAAGNAPNTDISITAAGDIVFTHTDNSGVPNGYVGVGNFGTNGASGGNISLTSTAGDIVLAATGDNSAILIGNAENGSMEDISGNVTLSADSVSGSASGANATVLIGNYGVNATGDTVGGNVTVDTGSGGLSLLASGSGALAQIGNLGDNGATVSGLVTVDSQGAITLDKSSVIGTSRIGNAGGASDSGNVSITGVSLTGDIGSSFFNDIPGGDFTLDLTGNGTLKLNDPISYTSSHNVSITTGGKIIATAGIQNSGSGGISVTSGGDLTLDSIAMNGGNIQLTSGGALTGNGAIETSGSGKIVLTSVNGMTLGGLVQTASGNLTLDAGGTLALDGGAQTGSGDIDLSGSNVILAATVQSTSGDIAASAAHNVTIGGNTASGNVFVGSKHGDTSVTAHNVSITGSNGYAQLGYHGAANGNLSITASGNVTLSGGGAGEYVQVGNGGYQTSGNESGNITIAANGAVTMTGGNGNNAYVQVGNGGSHANHGANGYSNTGSITISGQTVAMTGGAGNGSYVQAGNGGFLVGEDLAGGTATNTGDITINATGDITIAGGSGTDAYAQVGDGGDGVNKNHANSASGTNSGNIVVAVANSNGNEVTLQAGGGNNAYAEIGNGGFGNNSSGSSNINFTDSGNISVSDLTIIGSDTGANGYAQIGNGDDAQSGDANVSGDITIASGKITVTNGTTGNATIGNATGRGTVTGTITGYNPQSIDNSNTGAVSNLVQTTNPTNVFQPTIIQPAVEPQPALGGDDNGGGPLQKLANGGDEGNQDSDAVTDTIGKSLNGKGGKTVVSQNLIPGILRQVFLPGANQPRGIPPADRDYSSWGNEALWRW